MRLINKFIDEWNANGPSITIKKLKGYILYNQYLFPLYSRLHKNRVKSQSYKKIADPFELRNLNPLIIKKLSTFEGEPYWSDIGLIYDGDWDEQTRKLEDYDLYYGIINHFNEGISWKKTDYYNRVKKQIEEGKCKWGMTSVEDLSYHFEQIDSLYNSIKNDGYMSSRELKNTEKRQESDRPRYLPHTLNEIVIDINRHGEPLLVDGRHRLAICIALDIKYIPVLVVRRHHLWQETRDRIDINEDNSMNEHFDLIDITP